MPPLQIPGLDVVPRVLGARDLVHLREKKDAADRVFRKIRSARDLLGFEIVDFLKAVLP